MLASNIAFKKDVHPIAMILARGGSKRIPRKNIRNFCGKPMIAWPIETAIASGLFSSVIVSTEDAEIATVARSHGAETPFVRPQEIANDYATMSDVLKHGLYELHAQKGFLPQYCCCIYGTSAMLTYQHLKDGYEKLRTIPAECVFAATEYAHPLERSLQFDASGLVHYRYPEFVSTRTQDIQPSYHDLGLFYWFDVQAFLNRGGTSFLPLQKSVVVLSRSEVVDIDTEDDWSFAERLVQFKKTV